MNPAQTLKHFMVVEDIYKVMIVFFITLINKQLKNPDRKTKPPLN